MGKELVITHEVMINEKIKTAFDEFTEEYMVTVIVVNKKLVLACAVVKYYFKAANLSSLHSTVIVKKNICAIYDSDDAIAVVYHLFRRFLSLQNHFILLFLCGYWTAS